MIENAETDFGFLLEKAAYIRRETLRLHGLSPETRIASSLSDVELFCCLYYGKILNFDPSCPTWPLRDRLIVSKGHGGVSLYPILGDLGYFDKELMYSISQKGSIFSSIPDCTVPGIETVNGSLGLGLGVGVGMAVALRLDKSPAMVFVVLGDGELYEGSIWEAIMFAAHQKLNNLVVIVDHNRKSMLDYCKNIINIEPLENKFECFGWNINSVDGHNIQALYTTLRNVKFNINDEHPKVVISYSVKGRGVPELESDPLCHVRNIKPDRIRQLIRSQDE